jgi:ATP-dependent DNA helicase DinG
VKQASVRADLERVFGPEGPLARAIPGYTARPQQIDMALRVAQAIADQGRLIAEAGTGTGKTVAYLVPALLQGGKVIVSTGTKTLQDQLFHRDLPAVRDALGLPVTIALLKGRANYVCHHHLARNLADGRLASREDVRDLQLIARFARQTHTGDKAELSTVREDAPAWALATSTRENCLGPKCTHYNDCFIMKARKEALEAEVVVVNHHLFFADVMLKDEGMAELLPACNTVILDEAHQLPDIATLFFGTTVSTGQLLELSRDIIAEGITEAPDMREVQEAARRLDRATRDLRLAVPMKETRVPAHHLTRQEAFKNALNGLGDACRVALSVLKACEERGEGLKNCAARTAEMTERVREWVAEDDPTQVRWVEAYTQSIALHATPLIISDHFRRQLDGHARAWIFTSATLSMNGNFDHYCAQMGLEEADCASWESPFDYPSNGVIYLPRELPEPNSSEHTEAVVRQALPVLRASGGRAFLLFTTLRAMRLAHTLLAEHFKREGLDFPLLLQGEGTRTELLERFRKLGNAVLVASSSFWEGVDVRGDALSVVVIDKLPFAPPDDPVMQARLDAMRRDGGNPFMDYQLPQAAIALKQGAGRLIRDETDRGVLMIGDPRLATKAYGKKLVASLPAMRRTRELAVVEQFFQSGLPDEAAA